MEIQVSELRIPFTFRKRSLQASPPSPLERALLANAAPPFCPVASQTSPGGTGDPTLCRLSGIRTDLGVGSL